MAIDASAISESAVEGTQAIRRAASILRRIGQSGASGVGLSAITETLKLPRSTTHRILKCLVEEGLVHHNTATRKYSIGRLAYELGLTVTSEALQIGKWRGVVDRIAQRTGVTSYLLSRSGIEATCLLKAEGNTVIRVIPVEVGQRRLLGVGAGSAALLAAIDPEASEEIIRAIGPSLKGYPNLTEAVVRKIVAETRKTGFAVSRGHTVRDVLGIGMAVPKRGGVPSLAVSIATLASHASDEVVPMWKQIMREEVESVLND